MVSPISAIVNPFSLICSIFYALHNLWDSFSLFFRVDFMYLYQRLRELRESSGKSKAEIAEILHTAWYQYQKYEQGVQELPMHHFITLADFYGGSLDYIAGRADSRN